MLALVRERVCSFGYVAGYHLCYSAVRESCSKHYYAHGTGGRYLLTRREGLQETGSITALMFAKVEALSFHICFQV